MKGPLDLLRQAARLARAKGHMDAEIVSAVSEVMTKATVPVYIADNGEAVLMLTSASRGHVVPIPVRLIVGGADGVGPMYTDSPSPARVSTRGLIYIVREPVEDIRATIDALSGPDGGEG